jgi:crossover junction endodeoxyribonuclease RuvC
MYYVGIDPGKHGGLALLDNEQIISVMPMPLAGKDIDLTAITDWLLKPIGADSCEVWIEKVNAMPGQGVVSMFNFGYSVGAMHGIFAALHIPRYVVTPQAWKSEILAGTAKDKVAAIDWCRRTYPAISLMSLGARTPHSGMADALCIAVYGMRKRY